MIVKNLTTHKFTIELTDDELLHYMVMIAGSPQLHISSVDEMLEHLLKYIEQNYHVIIKEPPPDGH